MLAKSDRLSFCYTDTINLLGKRVQEGWLMKRVYGIDIGTTSIGWAVVEFDVPLSPDRIIAMGVRIFPEARDPDGTPLNQDRRRKRLVRRQLRRRRARRRALNTLFTQHGLLPVYSKDKDSAWTDVMRQPPLALRRKGLTEELEPHELGRALYHLARLRHYKGREIEEEASPEETSPDEKAAKSGRDQTIIALKASGETLGQWLAQRAPNLGLKKGVSNQYRIKGDVPREQTRRIHALRSHVEAEFDNLIQAQKAHHAVLSDPAFESALRETIFAQKPVFWRKNTLGRCRFIPDAPLCPKGSWLSQQRRVLEKVNNLTIVGGNMRPLDAEERAAILDRLQVQASMTWAGVRAALKPLYKKRGESGGEKTLRFNLELGGESKLLGNAVEGKLKEVFGASWADHPHKQPIRDAIHERLWQADYGEIGEQRVVILSEKERHERRKMAAKSFVRDFGISGEQAAALTNLQLPTGWEPYSVDALRAFLPRLDEGIRFGALTAGPEWADWRAASFPDREQPTGEILDKLPSPADHEEQKRQSAIRNPTVVRTQNELRKVVNNLIEAYGRPDLIRVELAREVGLSKREREKMQSGLRRQEKRRNEAEKDLKEKGIPRPSRADIEKWMLWKESQERCPYTGDQIGFDALFGDVRFDVEHIWPRSRSLDDSFRNKTLCRRDVNIAKGNRTPFEFYQGRPDDWSAVTNRLQNLVAGKGSPGIPLSKMRRFLAESIPEEFASRQLNDTGYAARQAVAFLKRLWPDRGPEAPVTVQAVTGRVTAQLRKLWELNNILSDDGEKTRADHRHHAIDALVVACTDPGVTNRLSRYWQQRDDPYAERPSLPPPWPGIREEAEKVVTNIIVSHRVKRKVSGPLHKETTYGDTGDDVTTGNGTYRLFVTTKAVNALSIREIDDIRDNKIRHIVSEWVTRHGGDPKKAFSTFPRVSVNGPEIKKVRLTLPMKLSAIAPASTDYAATGSNHHIAIYRSKDGILESEVVSLFEAVKRVSRCETVVRRTSASGTRLLMSLSLGDTFLIPSGDRAGYWTVKTIAGNGQIFCKPLNSADRSSSGQWGPSPAPLVKLGARKVSVDPIGRIRSAND